MIYLIPDTLEAHWTYVIVVALVLSVAYILFMKKYYYLYEIYLLRQKQNTSEMKITKALFNRLTEQAQSSPRLRASYDLRNTARDQSQRMLNAIEPGSVVPIHRHQKTSETVVCLRGRLVEEFYDELDQRCVETVELSPNGPVVALNIPAGQWHTVHALESGTVIMEVKDGRYEAVKQTLVYTNGHYELMKN